MESFPSAIREKTTKSSTISERPVFQNGDRIHDAQKQGSGAVFVEHGNGVPKEASFLSVIRKVQREYGMIFFHSGKRIVESSLSPRLQNLPQAYIPHPLSNSVILKPNSSFLEESHFRDYFPLLTSRLFVHQEWSLESSSRRRSLA